MCTIKSPNLLCTYVHIKPKLILFNIVAPPASYANINSLSTKPMFQTFHLEPINDVLCKELGLWGDWSGLLHLPNYCAHMCTIIFHRGIGYTTRYLSTSSTTTYLVQLDSYRIIPTMFNIDMYYTFILQLNVSELN